MTKQERKAKLKAKAEEELDRKNRKASGLQEVSKRPTPRMTPVQTPKAGSGFPSQSVSMAVSHTTFTPVSRIYTYKCPVYATTNRLAQGGVSAENKPIFYVELNSYEKPRKWIKRSVALLLEPNVLEL
jgi:hypothetical protein